MNIVISIIIFILLAGLLYLYRIKRQWRQLDHIKTYSFPTSIRDKLLKKHPQLTPDQMHLVFRALRDYFYMCNQANRRMVAMPSQVVDDAWHEFILFTRAYKLFCSRGLGRFLHHTPTEAMSSPTIAQEGIKRAWRLACAKEKINPRSPEKLPLIFEIDTRLNIENGFRYSLNCRDKNAVHNTADFCAGHIGCTSGCSGDSGASSDSSDGFFDGLFEGGGSDCGGGCGGD